MFDRLRELLRGSTDADEEQYRCVNCGAAFARSFRECPDCGGPYIAPVEDGRNT